jgi:hypothetical protein
VIIFRIDGRIIKRGALIGQLDHLVPIGVGKLALHFRPSAQSVMSEIWARVPAPPIYMTITKLSAQQS